MAYNSIRLNKRNTWRIVNEYMGGGANQAHSIARNALAIYRHRRNCGRCGG